MKYIYKKNQKRNKIYIFAVAFLFLCFVVIYLLSSPITLGFKMLPIYTWINFKTVYEGGVRDGTNCLVAFLRKEDYLKILESKKFKKIDPINSDYKQIFEQSNCKKEWWTVKFPQDADYLKIGKNEYEFIVYKDGVMFYSDNYY